MLKEFIFLVFILIISLSLLSQDESRIHRLGISGVYSNDTKTIGGAEISYQLYLKGIRRLEVDFGWLSSTSWDVLQCTGIYQWRLIRKGGFNFYMGPGAGIGYANYGYGEDKLYGILVGDIGIDYTFKFPIQIGLDYRPEWSLLQDKIGNELNHQINFAVRLAF